jgi:hypothetical protein
VTTAQTLWAVCGIIAFLLLPVGAFRMLAYLSGEVDHTPTMRTVARMALGIGGAALVAFLGLTAWFLVTDQRPW